MSTSIALLVECFGIGKAKKIRQRLDEICAADNLHDLYRLLGKKCYCSEDTSIVMIQTISESYIVALPGDLETDYRDWKNIKQVCITSLDGEVV